MPQGRSASPGWFVKFINEVVKGLGQVAAYLNDVIVFDSDPTAHVENIRALFERLRKHNLKFSPSKARLGATDADFLGHSILPAGVRPDADKISALNLNAHAAGSQAGAGPTGRCGLLSHIPA